MAVTNGLPPPWPFDPQGDKITRLSTQSARIESGQVYLRRNAPYLYDLHSEVMQFPYGKHDDQVDSISQFLNWVDKRTRKTARVLPLPI